MTEEQKQAPIEVQRYSVCEGWIVADEGGRLVTYEAFLALAQRAEAAEAKLAELAKQEPAAFTSEHYWSELNTFGAVKCVLLKNGNDPDFQVELFTRPVPASDLAELVPDDTTRMDWLVSKVVNVREPLHGDEKYVSNLREQIDATILRKIEEAK